MNGLILLYKDRIVYRKESDRDIDIKDVYKRQTKDNLTNHFKTKKKNRHYM